MILTIVHEIAHNFTFLCGTSASGSPFSLTDWPTHVGEAAVRSLISEASSKRVTGLVFGLVLQNAFGANTDYMPFGTFLIQ